jgi:hypothetical protein
VAKAAISNCIDTAIWKSGGVGCTHINLYFNPPQQSNVVVHIYMVVQIRMGSDTREHIALLKMGYWICDGELYGYSSHFFEWSTFKNWYEFCIRPGRGVGKDFLIIPTTTGKMELCEAEWDFSDGNLFHFNKRHLHFMHTYGGLLIRAVITVQRYTRRRIVLAVLKNRTFSKLVAFTQSCDAALPGDIIDNIIALTFVTSKFGHHSPVILVETDAFKQRLRAESHLNGTAA